MICDNTFVSYLCRVCQFGIKDSCKRYSRGSTLTIGNLKTSL